MQVASCEKELGWNPANTTRRIVLIATDAPFHLAGEGRVLDTVTLLRKQ